MRAILIALALLAPAAAQAGPSRAARSEAAPDGRSLELHANERAVVKIAPDGRLTLVSASEAAPERALPPKPRAGAPDAPLPDGPAPGTIAFTLGAVGPDLALKIESGLDKAVDYRAVSAHGRLKACTVLPLLESYERWPGVSGPLQLSFFTLRATHEVVCAPEGGSQ